MAWLSTPVLVPRDVDAKWRLQYASYDEKFLSTWSGIGGVPISGLTADGTVRVVRRQRIMDAAAEYPGLTYSAALSLANTLWSDVEYMGAKATKGVTDNWTVTARRRLYHPDGWSNWISEADLPEYS